MKKSKIFLVTNTENQLAEMVETPYDREDILQVLLERYPDLLPGDQIDPDEPRRWLLVSREVGVPGETQGANVWSLDHLFLDQGGIPTFVECKRAADTRARREVVAQMLDYAANGVSYWSVDALRQSAAETAQKAGRELDEDIQALLSEEEPADVEAYWQGVEDNLRSGRVRLIFVADSVPRELRRLVEFLNEKMSDVEVLAVEVKQFLGTGDHKAIVPRVLGITESAREAKSASRGQRRKVNREIVLANAEPEAGRLFAYILDYAGELGHPISWGVVGFSVRYPVPETKELLSYFFCYPPTLFQFSLQYINLAEADARSIRKTLLATGFFHESGKWTLSAEVTPKNGDRMREVVNRLFQQVPELINNSQ
jgi:hypothetical protein